MRKECLGELQAMSRAVLLLACAVSTSALQCYDDLLGEGLAQCASGLCLSIGSLDTANGGDLESWSVMRTCYDQTQFDFCKYIQTNKCAEVGDVSGATACCCNSADGCNDQIANPYKINGGSAWAASPALALVSTLFTVAFCLHVAH